MNNENIKEILDKLRSDDYYEKEYQKSVYYERDLKKLEDYITNLKKINNSLTTSLNKKIEEGINLQQENERLKQPQIFIDTQDMEERYGEELYKDYLEKQVNDYKSRIEKTVEYIKKYRAMYFPSGCGDAIEYVPLEFKRDYYENGSTFTETENLLDILNGKE